MNQKCPACKGRRTDGNGRTCQQCGGTGEVRPPSDERDAQAHVPYPHRPAQKEKSLRKRLISPIRQVAPVPEPQWLDLDRAASVEVTSEDPQHPIEGALVREDKRGWRASEAGTQTVRLIFDQPQNIERIELAFDENEAARTQEFVLRWMPNTGQSHEIVRQQWNFSPAGATDETEHYIVNLEAVAVLELVIQPDISRRGKFATLACCRLR